MIIKSADDAKILIDVKGIYLDKFSKNRLLKMWLELSEL